MYGFKIIILLITLVVSRLLFLDQDGIDYNFSSIYPDDELFYAIFSHHLANYGRLNFFDGTSNTALFLSEQYSFFVNYLGFKIFGNTFYGLRIGPALLSILGFLCYYYIIEKLAESKKELFLFSLLYIVNFTLLTLSRYQTPLALGLFLIPLVCLIFFEIQRFDQKNLNTNLLVPARKFYQNFLFLLLGLVSYALTAGYIYHLYLSAAIWGTISLYILVGKSYRNFIYLLTGCVLGIIYTLILMHFTDISFNKLFQVIQLHGTDSKASIVGIEGINFGECKSRLIKIIAPQFFKNNIGLFFLFLPSFLLGLTTFKAKNLLVNFILIGYILGCFQFFFEPSFTERKFSSFGICVILLIFLLKKDFFSEKSKLFKFSVYPISFLIAVNILITTHKRFYLGWHNEMKIGEFQFDEIFFYTSIICAIFILIILCLTKYKIFIIVPLLLLVPDIYLNYNFFIKNRTYTYKKSLYQISRHINEENTVGDFPHTMMLYNSSKPMTSLFNWRADWEENSILYLKNGTSKYFISRLYASNKDKLNNIKNITFGLEDEVIKLTLKEVYYAKPCYYLLYEK